MTATADGKSPAVGCRFALVHLLFLADVAAAEGWTQFRGPNGGGGTREAGLPGELSKTQNIRWRATLPGQGHSNPVIAGGKVFVTASSGFGDSRLHVLCFDQSTGKQLWHRKLQA